MSDMVIMPKSDAQAIWDKVREKTGVTGVLKSGEIAPLIDTITGGGGSEVKDVIPETDFSFVEDGGGIYAYTVENTYQLEEGKTYKVLWDGEEYEFVWTLYTVTVMDGQVIPIGHALGNPYFFNIYSGGATNFEDTGDPFMIGIASDNTFAILTNETDSTHTVAVYEGSTGGNSDDVRYVTFMSEDGSTELCVKPVAVGDDCANVIDRGLISTPTKESTPQYNYTFTGWSLTPNGTADANALKSVTEDRTVYVAFKSVLRYYTIRYYDGDALLKSESLAYGSMPSYTPTKSGWAFDGWSPELAIVTGDVTYTAKWAEPTVYKLADYTWDELISLSESGKADRFEVGDTRSVTITNGGSGTIDTSVRLIATNFDDNADGSGKIGMTFELLYPCGFTGLNYDTFVGYNTTEENTKTWATCKGLSESNLDTSSSSLVRRLEASIPRASLKTFTKKYYDFNTGSISTVDSKIWIRSLSEFGFNSGYDEGECYPIHTAGKSLGATSADCVYTNVDGVTAVNHWTRSKLASGKNWYRITESGKAESVAGTTSSYCIHCFGI